MRSPLLIAAFGLLAAPALAESHAMGDAAAGEKEFRKCKSCHTIASADETIVKGGRTGPNLYNVVGRAAGSVEDFKYSSLMEDAAATGLVWDQENLVAFLEDPSAYLSEVAGDKGRSKMSFKLTKGGADMAAYLASVSPDAPAMDEEAEAESDS